MTILDTIKDKIDLQTAMKQSVIFSNLTQDQERVKKAIQICQDYNIDIEKSFVQKNIEQSKKWRDIGNRTFIQSKTPQDFMCACEWYSKSVAYAPNNSNELSLAYGNRSAALFRLGKYEESVQDIDRCLNSDCPDHLRVKMLLRKTRCLAALKEASRVEQSYKEALEWIENNLTGVEINEMKKRLDDCAKCIEGPKEQESNVVKSRNKNVVFKKFRFKVPNKEVPVCSNALAVKYDEVYGRHVVATRDIRPGEILSDEVPYSLVLNLENQYSYCWGCLEYTFSGIPCEDCVNVLYCSEHCKEKSWKLFHQVECPVLKHLLSLDNTEHMVNLCVCCLRLAILAVKELGSISNLIDEVEDVEKCEDPLYKGFHKDGKFYSNKYRSVYSLVTNTDKRSVADLFDRSIYAAIVVYYLATKTDFFDERLPEDWEKLYNNEKVTFIGGLILRHQQIIPSNMHSYDEVRNFTPGVYDGHERGGAVMPFLSLVNHSCFPNIGRNCRNGRIWMFAFSPIKKGEQVFDNYGRHFALRIKPERNIFLNEIYYFTCHCIACKENWPVYKELAATKTTDKTASDLLMQQAKLGFTLQNLSQETIGNMPHILEDTSKMLTTFTRHFTMPNKKVFQVTESLRMIFDITGNCLSLPKIVEPKNFI